MIHFAAKTWSMGFILAAFSLFLFVISSRLKQRDLERFIQKNLLPFVTLHAEQQRQTERAAFFLAALSLLILALMRPQWGTVREQIKQRGYDILFAIDVSKSMLAEDLKPNRLERAKLAVADCVGKLAGDRVGLVAFAGDAFLACPLTTDAAAFEMVLDSLNPESLAVGGTSIAAAIREAVRAGREGADSEDKVLILISDGEDHEGDVLAAAADARNNGMHIYAIGVGSPEGELISVTDSQGKSEYLKNRKGQVVKSRLNETLLENVAVTTGGRYIHATPTNFGLEAIYENAIKSAKEEEFKTQTVRRREERFQIFLGMALILLLWEASFPGDKKT